MAFDTINNYFERLVFEELHTKIQNNQLENEDDFLGDIACVALNQLPSRYVRHNVDMVFYMTAEERVQNEVSVRDAVARAIDYVNKHRHNDRPETISQ